MPNYWTSLPSSPAVQRRDEVAQACARHGAQLLGNQLSYDAGGNCWALIHIPDERTADAVFTDPDVRALEATGYLSAEEQDAGKKPPPAWRRPATS